MKGMRHTKGKLSPKNKKRKKNCRKNMQTDKKNTEKLCQLPHLTNC